MSDPVTEATKADPKPETNPDAPAPASTEAPASVLPLDRYGRHFDPAIHKHYRRGRGKGKGMELVPKLNGDGTLEIRSGPGTKPKADSYLPANSGGQSNGGSDPQFDPLAGNSGGTGPAPGAPAEAFDPELRLAFLDETGILIGGDKAAMSEQHKARLARAMSGIEKRRPGSIPEPHPVFVLMIALGDWIRTVTGTDVAQERIAWCKLQLMAKFGGEEARTEA